MTPAQATVVGTTLRDGNVDCATLAAVLAVRQALLGLGWQPISAAYQGFRGGNFLQSGASI